MSEPRKDLALLVADKDMEHAVRGLLARSESLDLGAIEWDIDVHPERDPGCYGKSAEFLRVRQRSHRHALVLFDRHGCGHEGNTRAALEVHVEEALQRTGWSTRAAAVVIDPELEAWVWSDSSHVDRALGWPSDLPVLRDWLIAEGHLSEGATKPARPKEAMEAALRRVGKPRSAARFEQLARTVSLERCEDPSFAKFKTTLRTWFPRSAS